MGSADDLQNFQPRSLSSLRTSLVFPSAKLVFFPRRARCSCVVVVDTPRPAMVELLNAMPPSAAIPITMRSLSGRSCCVDVTAETPLHFLRDHAATRWRLAPCRIVLWHRGRRVLGPGSGDAATVGAVGIAPNDSVVVFVQGCCCVSAPLPPFCQSIAKSSSAPAHYRHGGGVTRSAKNALHAVFRLAATKIRQVLRSRRAQAA